MPLGHPLVFQTKRRLLQSAAMPAIMGSRSAGGQASHSVEICSPKPSVVCLFGGGVAPMTPRAAAGSDDPGTGPPQTRQQSAAEWWSRLAQMLRKIRQCGLVGAFFQAQRRDEFGDRAVPWDQGQIAGEI